MFFACIVDSAEKLSFDEASTFGCSFSIADLLFLADSLKRSKVEVEDVELATLVMLVE